jgi:hypothetical protein
VYKKLTIIFFIIFSLNFIHSIEFSGSGNISTRFIITAGIDYNLKISTNYYYEQDILPLSIPLKFGFDTRFAQWFSLYAGVDFIYQIRTINKSISNEPTTLYNNNFFIDLPIIFKFYPLASSLDVYENFYIGLGIFPHFWVVNNIYYISGSKSYSENAYDTTNEILPPKNIYTPVNVGFHLSIGNHFPVTDTFLIGIELFSDYLFIPVLNGSYVKPPVMTDNDYPQLDFYINFGFALSFAFQISGY